MSVQSPKKKTKVPSDIISEPIDKLVTEEELNAPIPSDQQITFLGSIKKYNPDSNAKTIEVQRDGSVIYSY